MVDVLDRVERKYDRFYHNIYHNRIMKTLNRKKDKDFYYNLYKEIPFDDEDATCKLIGEAYCKLDEKLASIFRYRYMFNFTVKETSNKMQISEARVIELTRKGTYKLLNNMKAIQIHGDNLLISEELDTRTYNILKRAGYDCNSDLEGIDYITFSKYRNAGKTSWKILCKYMDNHGISYDKGDPDISIFSEKLSNTIYRSISNKCPSQQQLDDIQKYIDGIISIVSDMSDL